MLYCPVYPDQRGPVNTTAQISGRNLAHGHRSKAERVLTAADLIDGRLVLIKPTATQAAKLLDISLPYVFAATKVAWSPERRRAVLAGEVPLYRVADGESLADRFRRASRGERLLAAHELGPELIWDQMIAPIV
jgi:hypothetical protein